LKLIGLRVENFKGAANLYFELQDLTALVGINGSGKTTILEALDLFFNNTPISNADYGSKDAEITIMVRFIDVPGKNRPVSITRKWVWDNGKPNVKDVPTEGLGWDDRERILNGVHVIFEHAEHETDNDGTDESDLGLVEMIKSATKNTLTADSAPDLNSQLEAHFSTQENNISRFKEEVNLKLRGNPQDAYGYAPDAEVHFALQRPNLKPTVRTKFVESGTHLEHKSVGHGTKRAYHMAAMEVFAEMSTKPNDRLILLLIDEPELHQHPQRQRRILQTYRRLSKQPNCQVIYSTHSQEFIDLDMLYGIYRISRNGERGIVATQAPELPDKVKRWNIARKLIEGLFSAGVILVEGWEDQAILDGIFSMALVGEKSLLKKFIENDINIIECNGVGNMPVFVRFFRELDIPVFAMWDADRQDSSSERNKNMLEALGSNDSFPSKSCSECNPGTDYVCFACDACMYFKEQFGHASTDDNPNAKNEIKSMIREMVDLRPVFRTPEFEGSDFFANKTVLFHNRFFPPS